MECRDVREMADSFLAAELLTETNHEILRHVETCPVCRDDLAARRAVREGVRRAFHRSPDLAPAPEFVARLRASLQSAHHPPARRGFGIPGWLALAATVLLAVALGMVYHGRNRAGEAAVLARAAVGDHQHCAVKFQLKEKPISLAEAGPRYGAMYRVMERVPADDVNTAVGSAHVLERHACVYEGRRFAHVVFRYQGELVSLLVTAADGGWTPALSGSALPHVTSGRIENTSVVSFRASRQMVFLAGNVAGSDLSKLADAVAGPLYRELTASERVGRLPQMSTPADQATYALEIGPWRER